MCVLRSAVALTLIALLNHTAAAATLSQDTADTAATWRTTPLTGRAIPCQDGKILTFECRNVELLAYLPKASLGQSAGFDLWGWHDSTTGREFVLIGGAATAFVEVTDPVHPKYLGMLRPRVGSGDPLAQSVKVYQHYALIGYEGGGGSPRYGIQIFDLTQLRRVTTPPVEFQETAYYDGLANTHTIAVNPETGFAYVNGSNTCGGGLHMLDVRTPTQPTHAGCYTEARIGLGWRSGYVHDAHCVRYRGPDKQYHGRELCVTFAETGISVADVTDKRQPKTIGVASYPNALYTHQGWFTEDHRYVFINDEFDEVGMNPLVALMHRRAPDPNNPYPKPQRTRTIVFDLSDVDDPVVAREYYATTTDTDHNLYIRGRYMYQANNHAGLRIIDVRTPTQPQEVGYLTRIGKAWGPYPYFKNDVVAVSTDAGLFLVRLRPR